MSNLQFFLQNYLNIDPDTFTGIIDLEFYINTKAPKNIIRLRFLILGDAPHKHHNFVDGSHAQDKKTRILHTVLVLFENQYIYSDMVQ